MATRELKVNITGDASSLNRAFRDVSSGSSRLGSSLKKVGKVAAVGVGAAFAGMAATLKVGFDEMAEGQKVAAQTSAALKSTGGVANVTARDVDKLATSISRMTGIDDEAVQASENMLLTFTNVRNEVGKGNDIFNQATGAIADMATRMNNGAIPSAEQLSTTAVRVGKALNDPIKGMTALGRVGVQFTDAQKAQIKEMVKAGDTMGAQKLILAELNKEFGGSAKAAGETFPGQLAKLRNSFEEMAGAIVETLLPYLQQFADWANRNMPTIQAVITTTLDAIVATIQFLAPIIATLIDWFQRLRAATEEHWPRIQAVIMGVVNWFKINILPTVAAVVGAIIALWRKFGDDIVAVVRPAFEILATIIRTAINNIKAIVEFVMAVIRGDWSKAWDALKSIVSNTLNGLRSIITTALSNLVPALLSGAKALGAAILQGLGQGLANLGSFIVAQLQKIPGALAAVAAQVPGWAASIGRAIVSGILSGLGGLWDALKSKLEGTLKGVLSSLNPFSPVEHGGEKYIGIPLAEGTIRGWITGSKELPEKMAESIRNAVQTAAQAVADSKGALESAFSELTSVATSAFDRITRAHETATERRIRLEDEARAAAERRAALEEAQAQRAEAFASGDPAAIAAAEKAVEDAKFAIRRAADEKRAAQERAAYEARRERQRANFEEELEALQERLLKGEISQKEAQERLLKLMKKYQIPFKDAAKKLGGALADGLRDAIDDVARAAQAVRDTILKYLSHIQVRINIDVTAPDRNTDGREHGGPVRRGRAYIVGEAGPELFVPRTSGQVLSNAQSGAALAGGGGISINFYGPTVGTSREFEDTVRRALYDVQKRNPGTGLVPA